MLVMTFNIRGGEGIDGHCSLQRIAEIVLQCAPDVVCFQEIHQRTPWRAFADQPRHLERLLGFPLVFQRNLNLGFGGEGIGIATPLPIVSVRRSFLTSVRERRGLLEARIRTPIGIVSLFCTHWGLSPAERLCQAEETARAVTGSTDPVVLCGDLNDRSDCECLRYLLAHTDLVDVGAVENAPTYPADNPTHRIDYILCSRTLDVDRVGTLPTSASDHYAVLADLT